MTHLSSALGVSEASLFTRVRGETVWKIAEGVSSTLLWRQEAADRDFFDPSWPLRSPNSGSIPNFQTVSEGEFSEVRRCTSVRHEDTYSYCERQCPLTGSKHEEPIIQATRIFEPLAIPRCRWRAGCHRLPDRVLRC